MIDVDSQTSEHNFSLLSYFIYNCQDLKICINQLINWNINTVVTNLNLNLEDLIVINYNKNWKI